MTYVNMKTMLEKAKKNHYAVGAFNIVNELTAKAVVETAEDLKQDVILQTSVKTVKAFGAKELMDILKPLAQNTKINVAIHLDHSRDIEYTKECIAAGWSSVMYDGSQLSLEENIANTKIIVDYAHKRNVTVEGELGAIVGVEDDIVVEKDGGAFADPKDCKKFMAETGVDALAPAVGTAHGVYKGEINLNYKLMQDINAFSPVPLVLHGGTGLSAEMFDRMIQSGAAKVNISTAIKIAYCQGMRKYMDENPQENDPLKLDAFAEDCVKEVARKHIRLFSQMDRAPYAVDLHTHSTRSDGGDTPQELIDNATKRGVKVLALTDHDVIPPQKIEVNGIMVDPVAYAKTKGIQFIPGIEFSCETLVDDVHVVALGCDFHHQKILDMNRKIVQSKIDSYYQLTALLTEKGMPIAWDEVLNYGGIPRKPEDVQKKIIFNLMAEKGYTDTWIEAKLLCRNNPEYGIKRKKPSAVEIIRLIHEVGGIAILAHPYLIDDVVRVDDRKMSRDDFIDWLIAEGLDGIEASYTYDKTTYGGELTKEEIIQKVKKDYSNRVKIISGGSDYHADYKRMDQKVRNIGECGITYEYFSNNELLSKLKGGDQNERTT